MNIAKQVHDIILSKKITLSLAESCTGGGIASSLVQYSGASNYLRLGLVVYSVESKIKIGNVEKELIDNYGVVSEQVAISLATNVRNILNTDIGLGITGLAGPGGDEQYPEGTAFVAINFNDRIICEKLSHKGSRINNIDFFIEKSLALLYSHVENS